jgi:hypothetical protein
MLVSHTREIENIYKFMKNYLPLLLTTSSSERDCDLSVVICLLCSAAPASRHDDGGGVEVAESTCSQQLTSTRVP